jgi:hypothetical protein
VSTVVCTKGLGGCGAGTLYVGCILLCTRYIREAGVRFFPSGEGGGLRRAGYGDKTD